MGTWMHGLLEAHYKGEDWTVEQARRKAKFQEMFEEEQEFYGDMPGTAQALMEAYLWHYQHDEWKVHEVEFSLETKWPDGDIYRMRADALVEDQFGLWLVDHKWPKNIPNSDFRLRDRQSALYLWACKREGIPVKGFIWNYGRRKKPSTPKVLKSGQLSTRRLDGEYVSLVRALKAHKDSGGHVPAALVGLARHYRAMQYRPGELTQSTYFQRFTLEKDDAMLKQVAAESYHTKKRYKKYPFHQPAIIERQVDRSCDYFCPYNRLCTTEFMGGNVAVVLKGFVEKSPDYYYQDDKLEVPE